MNAAHLARGRRLAAAMAMQDCARFGMHASRIVVDYVGLGGDAIVVQRFRLAEDERTRARAVAFGERKYGIKI